MDNLFAMLKRWWSPRWLSSPPGTSCKPANSPARGPPHLAAGEQAAPVMASDGYEGLHVSGFDRLILDDQVALSN